EIQRKRMSFEQIEKLKKQLTDQYVVVDASVPELRRFKGLTGRIKTVNFSGRALVEFDGPADIGWYDIEPSYLQVVDQPIKKVEAAKAEKEAPVKPAAVAKPPAAKPGGKMSPLEMARAQGAAGGAKPATAEAKAPAAKPATA